MKRVITKIGDIFTVKLDNKKRYFQYIANDRTQLNSDVIRAFKKTYSEDANPNVSEIISDEVDFYVHCVVKLGVKMNLWEKVGNSHQIGDLTSFLFKDTNDCARKAGEEPIKVSENWYVWRINDKDFTRIGKLEGEYKKAFIGLVVNPYDIVNRMWKGKYLFDYPGFE